MEVHVVDYYLLDGDDGWVLLDVNCSCGDQAGRWSLLYLMMLCHQLRNSAHSFQLNGAGLL